MKRTVKILGLVFCMAALITAAAGGAYATLLSAQDSGDSQPGQPLSAEEQKALALLNSDRMTHGLTPLKANLTLTAAAREHAQDMIDRSYFAHNSPEGESPFDRMRRYGVAFRYAGENVGMNSSVEAAEQAFMDSTGHRANILGTDYTEVGIGVRHGAGREVYVVQEFIGN